VKNSVALNEELKQLLLILIHSVSKGSSRSSSFAAMKSTRFLHQLNSHPRLSESISTTLKEEFSEKIVNLMKATVQPDQETANHQFVEAFTHQFKQYVHIANSIVSSNAQAFCEAVFTQALKSLSSAVIIQFSELTAQYLDQNVLDDYWRRRHGPQQSLKQTLLCLNNVLRIVKSLSDISVDFLLSYERRLSDRLIRNRSIGLDYEAQIHGSITEAIRSANKDNLNNSSIKQLLARTQRMISDYKSSELINLNFNAFALQELNKEMDQLKLAEWEENPFAGLSRANSTNSNILELCDQTNQYYNSRKQQLRSVNDSLHDSAAEEDSDSGQSSEEESEAQPQRQVFSGPMNRMEEEDSEYPSNDAKEEKEGKEVQSTLASFSPPRTSSQLLNRYRHDYEFLSSNSFHIALLAGLNWPLLQQSNHINKPQHLYRLPPRLHRITNKFSKFFTAANMTSSTPLNKKLYWTNEGTAQVQFNLQDKAFILNVSTIQMQILALFSHKQSLLSFETILKFLSNNSNDATNNNELIQQGNSALLSLTAEKHAILLHHTNSNVVKETFSFSDQFSVNDQFKSESREVYVHRVQLINQNEAFPLANARNEYKWRLTLIEAAIVRVLKSHHRTFPSNYLQLTALITAVKAELSKRFLVETELIEMKIVTLLQDEIIEELPEATVLTFNTLVAAPAASASSNQLFNRRALRYVDPAALEKSKSAHLRRSESLINARQDEIAAAWPYFPEQYVPPVDIGSKGVDSSSLKMLNPDGQTQISTFILQSLPNFATKSFDEVRFEDWYHCSAQSCFLPRLIAKPLEETKEEQEKETKEESKKEEQEEKSPVKSSLSPSAPHRSSTTGSNLSTMNLNSLVDDLLGDDVAAVATSPAKPQILRTYSTEAAVQNTTTNIQKPLAGISSVSKNELYDRLAGLVHSVGATINLSPPQAERLLFINNWNEKKLIDCWIENEEETKRKAGIALTGEQLSSNNNAELSQSFLSQQSVTCNVCYDDFPLGRTVSLYCGHYFCTDCWQEYLKKSVLTIDSGISKCCMQPKCSAGITIELVDRVTNSNKQSLAQWNNQLIRSYISANKSMRWCSNPRSCDNIIIIENPLLLIDSGIIRCSICHYIACTSCEHPEHELVSCNQMKSWEEKNGYIETSDEMKNTRKLIALTTKNCPRCHKAIEKNGGCKYAYYHSAPSKSVICNQTFTNFTVTHFLCVVQSYDVQIPRLRL
jgi:hypothetical protein